MEKIKSRKFQVWLVFTFLMVYHLFILQNLTPELINGYTIISALYIGGNVAQDYITRHKK